MFKETEDFLMATGDRIGLEIERIHSLEYVDHVTDLYMEFSAAFSEVDTTHIEVQVAKGINSLVRRGKVQRVDNGGLDWFDGGPQYLG